jgi:hypothetical protein
MFPYNGNINIVHRNIVSLAAFFSGIYIGCNAKVPSQRFQKLSATQMSFILKFSTPETNKSIKYFVKFKPGQ